MHLDRDQKEALRKRLRRAEGQVAAVGRMIEEDKYCVDVLMQVRAAMAALGKVGQIVLENHLDTCVSAAFQADDDAERQAKIRELMDVFAQYGNFGTR
ncbi:metal-sensitive transcriptional regulator [Alienimonas californiensis]|uniref:Copper-sensing transcriptional repressor CsoR n=1 Tax=Alienimonas californiensis TaxID=2527989 RepID=A0A517P5V6_9PLAN|nr:metal-sensitive transcriptional regulator [Alienimonas californiensis]QDT14735.1 Copper-sensing transcriptional repressor CsoR [Alienimonas californiensis]